MKAQITLNQEVKDKIVELVRVYAQLQQLKHDYSGVSERCPFAIYSDEGQKWLNDSYRRLDAGIKSESRRLRDLYEAFNIDYNGDLLPLPDNF